MSKEEDNSSEEKLFVTEFPKGEFGIVDYLQGRVHFALMDQMKLMHKSGMKQEQIKEAIMKTVSEIVSNFEPKKRIRKFLIPVYLIPSSKFYDIYNNNLYGAYHYHFYIYILLNVLLNTFSVIVLCFCRITAQYV